MVIAEFGMKCHSELVFLTDGSYSACMFGEDFDIGGAEFDLGGAYEAHGNIFMFGKSAFDVKTAELSAVSISAYSD